MLFYLVFNILDWVAMVKRLVIKFKFRIYFYTNQNINQLIFEVYRDFTIKRDINLITFERNTKIIIANIIHHKSQPNILTYFKFIHML